MKLFLCCSKNKVIPIDPGLNIPRELNPIGSVLYLNSGNLSEDKSSEENLSSDKYTEIDSVLSDLNKYIIDLFKLNNLYLSRPQYFSIKLLEGKVKQLSNDYDEIDKKIYMDRKNIIMINFYKNLNKLFIEKKITIDKELFKDKTFYDCLKNPYNRKILRSKFSFED